MKQFYLNFLVLAVCAFSFSLQAQETIGYTWSKLLNNSSPIGGTVAVQAVKTDAAGNIFVAGDFTFTVDVDPGVGTTFLTSAGSYDMFIAKYSETGTLLYVKQLGSASEERCSSLALDGSGNIYIGGLFFGTSDFDPSAATANLTSTGNYDAFFAKYDANGNYLFAKRVGGSSTDRIYSLSVDNSNIYITGTFYNTVDFDPGAGTANLVSAGLEDLFFAKYDASGNYVFAKSIGSTSFDGGKSITVDAAGSLYLTGYFRGTADFDPGAGTASLTASGSAEDAFLAKYNSAGNYVYAKRMGSTGSDNGNAIVVDATGSVYVTGTFIGTADFDPGAGTVNLVGAGNRDIFLAKYDASGNYVYAKGMGGTGSDIGNSLVIDASGNAYITGIFQNTVDFDPGAGTVNLTGAGNNDLFFAKYDASGNYVLAKGFGSSSGDSGTGIALGSSNQIIVAGIFNGTVDFDAGAGTANLVSGTSAANGFVMRYDNAGNYSSAIALGGLDGTEYQEKGNGIAVDGSGNVYTAGYMRGSVDFDPGSASANLSSAGEQDIFFAKHNANGEYVFAKTIGGTGNDIAYDIALDASGNMYITGTYEGTVDFDPGAGTANLTSTGSSDIFIAKYDAAGNYVFAKSMGSTDADLSVDLALDGSSNVYITGSFQGTVDFDAGAGTANLTSAGFTDIFFAKYDTNGNFIYAKGMGGTSLDAASSLSLDESGNLYLTGSFYSTADFDPGAGTANLTSQAGSDLFFAKYDASGNYVFAKSIGGFATDAGIRIVAAGGNIYLAASFSDDVDFDPGAGAAIITGDFISDIAFAKYDASGNYLFAKKIGATGTDEVSGLAVDAGGNLYITGTVMTSADFDPGAATVIVNPSGIDATYLAKYDTNGNYVYAKGILGSNTGSSTIALDGSNNLYITGQMVFTVDFDPGSGVASFTSSNNADIFIAKYSTCTAPQLSSISLNASPATVTAATSLTDGGCRLLATLQPNGASPVSGTVNAQLWIESSVPTYAGQPFVARHYEITPVTNPSTSTGRVTLYFTQQEFTDFNNHPNSALDLPSGAADAAGISNLRVGKYSGTTNNGTGLPGSYSNDALLIDPADTDIVWNAAQSRWEVSVDVTGFSGFIVQTSATTLPVSLTQFNAAKKGEQTVLSWTTSTEQDNKGFAIERSANGSNFIAIGFVQAKGNGNSTATQQYNFTDANPLPTRNYYRLQQQDVNGNRTYSAVRMINFSKSFAVLLYPNPVVNSLTIDLQNTQPAALQLNLSDLQGRRLRSWHFSNASGILQLNLNGLAPGYYQLELINNKGEKELHRLLKQ